MTDESNSPPLPNTISRRTLIIGFLSLTLLPVLIVGVLFQSQPTPKDPKLDVVLSIAPRPWQADDVGQTRLLPSLIVLNPTTEAWNNVNIAINDQFFYYHDKPVEPSEQLTIPLKFFHTKGNQTYPPEHQALKTITVYAQIPSGARAIAEFEGSKIDWTQ